MLVGCCMLSVVVLCGLSFVFDMCFARWSFVVVVGVVCCLCWYLLRVCRCCVVLLLVMAVVVVACVLFIVRCSSCVMFDVVWSWLLLLLLCGAVCC